MVQNVYSNWQKRPIGTLLNTEGQSIEDNVHLGLQASIYIDGTIS